MATTRTRIGPADHGRAMTLADFLDADEEAGYRYELSRGLLEVTNVPGAGHWQVLDNLHELISAYRRDHPGLIRRVGGGSECRVWIPAMASGRNPDLAIVFRGALCDDRGDADPWLVVEIVSRGGEARDRVAKREEYLAFGIREYWIIDPARREAEVLSRIDGPGGPEWQGETFRDAETIRSGLLRGFVGTLADLWTDVPPAHRD